MGTIVVFGIAGWWASTPVWVGFWSGKQADAPTALKHSGELLNADFRLLVRMLQ
jgi:hypothetical protein